MCSHLCIFRKECDYCEILEKNALLIVSSHQSSLSLKVYSVFIRIAREQKICKVARFVRTRVAIYFGMQ